VFFTTAFTALRHLPLLHDYLTSGLGLGFLTTCNHLPISHTTRIISPSSRQQRHHPSMAEKDVESGAPTKLSHFRQVYDQAGITPEVQKHDYAGSGTEEDPYVVTWIDNDPRNPMLYSKTKKWSITMMVAVATLAVAFVSSAYSGGANEVIMEFQISQEVFVLGTSLFVLGFAIGESLLLSMFVD